MRMAYLTVSAGLCVVASCAWGAARLFDYSVSDKPTIESVGKQSVERTNKADRLVNAFNVQGMTVVAKRAIQSPEHLSDSQAIGSSGTARELPDGCEGSFSRYVDPEMANVIGRCVS
jgi:hypothetical protein